MLVDDEDRASRYLLSIGYYRLSAYYIPFYKDLKEHLFRENVTFDDVLRLYIFDRKLRCLYWEALERIEIQIRTQWVYWLVTETKNPFAHLDPSNFRDYDSYCASLNKLQTEVVRAEKEEFIAHFQKEYSEKLPPLWACVHFMTFGELIRWVDNTFNPKVKSQLARSLGFNDYLRFHSFAVALTELRNVCAHHVRLWNRTFMKKHSAVRKLLTPGFEQVLPINSTSKIFSLSLLISSSLITMNPKTSWPYRLRNLVEANPEWQQHAMGFPADWQSIGFFRKN